MERRPTIRASRACAEWLSWCLSIGWKHSDLDALQSLWWEYHDDDGHLAQHDKAANRG